MVRYWAERRRLPCPAVPRDGQLVSGYDCAFRATNDWTNCYAWNRHGDAFSCLCRCRVPRGQNRRPAVGSFQKRLCCSVGLISVGICSRKPVQLAKMDLQTRWLTKSRSKHCSIQTRMGRISSSFYSSYANCTICAASVRFPSQAGTISTLSSAN